MSFYPAGEFTIGFLQKTLGFQRVFSVTTAYGIGHDWFREEYVGLHADIEDEHIQTCKIQPIHYGRLELAQAHVMAAREKTKLSITSIKQHRARLSFRVKKLIANLPFLHKADGSAGLADRELFLQDHFDKLHLEYMPYPERLQCGVVLPLGTSVYVLRDNGALLNGCGSLHVLEVVNAIPYSLERGEKSSLTVRYTLSDGSSCCIKPEDICTELQLPMQSKSARYYLTRKAAVDHFLTLQKNLVLRDSTENSASLNKAMADTATK